MQSFETATFPIFSCVVLLTQNNKAPGANLVSSLKLHSPLGIIFNLTPAHQNFDANVKNSDAALPVWKPQNKSTARCCRVDGPEPEPCQKMFV